MYFYISNLKSGATRERKEGGKGRGKVSPTCPI